MNLLQHWQRIKYLNRNGIMGNCFTCLKSDASEGHSANKDAKTEPSSTVTTARGAGTCVSGITVPELADKGGESWWKRCNFHRFWWFSLTETAELLTHGPSHYTSIAGSCDNHTGSLKKSALLMLNVNTNVPDTMPMNSKHTIGLFQFNSWNVVIYRFFTWNFSSKIFYFRNINWFGYMNFSKI